jgi:hypothetical protein
LADFRDGQTRDCAKKNVIDRIALERLWLTSEMGKLEIVQKNVIDRIAVVCDWQEKK